LSERGIGTVLFGLQKADMISEFLWYGERRKSKNKKITDIYSKKNCKLRYHVQIIK
jgi:hypothetical protein